MTRSVILESKKKKRVITCCVGRFLRRQEDPESPGVSTDLADFGHTSGVSGSSRKDPEGSRRELGGLN